MCFFEARADPGSSLSDGCGQRVRGDTRACGTLWLERAGGSGGVPRKRQLSSNAGTSRVGEADAMGRFLGRGTCVKKAPEARQFKEL